MGKTEIQRFYTNKTILVTGGTGFMGKLLIEKLLRSCPDVERIIVPIRPKKHISAEKRISEYFQDKAFDVLKDMNSNIFDKVLFVSTDLEQNNCGLSNEDYNIITTTTNIVFHSAACVDFNLSIMDAINCNIRVTKNVIDIAKEITNLQAFIHVSTMWSHAIMKVTEEKVYKLSHEPEALLNLVDKFDEKSVEKMSRIIQDKWPNMYTMSKNICENIVYAEKDNLPIAIFRPGAIISTYKEPLPRISSLQAASMVGIGLATGLIQVFPVTGNHAMHFVPADYVVNCTVAVGWRVGTRQRPNDIKIYNYVPVNNFVTRRQYVNSFVHTKYPLEETIWPPSPLTTSSKWLFEKYDTLYHKIPAYIHDKIFSSYRKPKYTKIMKRNMKIIEPILFYLLSNFRFESKNVPVLWNSLSPEDQKLFMFDLDSLDWNDVMDMFTKSVKELLNEDFDNMEKCEGKRKLLLSKY